MSNWNIAKISENPFGYRMLSTMWNKESIGGKPCGTFQRRYS